MRIRKNAKISPLLFSNASGSATAPPTHVCQLNQSPWDVLLPPSPPLPPLDSAFLLRRQAEAGDESGTANGSLGDSVEAIESVASMKLSVEAGAEEQEEDKPIISPPDAVWEGGDIAAVERDKMTVDRRRRNDRQKERRGRALGDKGGGGMGWHRKREAQATEGGYSSDHRSPQLNSYANNNNQYASAPKKSGTAAEAAAAAEDAVEIQHRPRRARPKKPPPSSASSNPYEFYYYSGFGPRWGKRRGGGDGGQGGGGDSNNNNNNNKTALAVETTPSSSMEVSHGGGNSGADELDFQHDNDDDDDGDEDDDVNRNKMRKRVRKPVKERSLKSLM